MGLVGTSIIPSVLQNFSIPGMLLYMNSVQKGLLLVNNLHALHIRCHVCKELEVKKDPILGFAICRRCPHVYHRKCLPREIASENDVLEDMSGELLQRAWENPIPHRTLIYCLAHEIDPEILTPARDHIKFPDPQPKK